MFKLRNLFKSVTAPDNRAILRIPTHNVPQYVDYFNTGDILLNVHSEKTYLLIESGAPGSGGSGPKGTADVKVTHDTITVRPALDLNRLQVAALVREGHTLNEHEAGLYLRIGTIEIDVDGEP